MATTEDVVVEARDLRCVVEGRICNIGVAAVSSHVRVTRNRRSECSGRLLHSFVSRLLRDNDREQEQVTS